MGGKSSSSSSSSTTTNTSDERIAATDNAMVTRVAGNNNTLSDYGAIEAAGELTLDVINNLTQVAMASLTQTQSAVDVLGQSTDNAYEFANYQTQNQQAKSLQDSLPCWLLAFPSLP